VGSAVVIPVGLDAGSGSLREADHLVHDLVEQVGLPQGSVGCTHLIRSGARHVALSFSVAEDVARDLVALAERERFGVALGATRLGPAELAAGAAEAAAQHGQSGRAVIFPGVAELTGTVTVGAMLADSAIDQVTVLASPDGPADGDLVQTRDHVRPEWRDGLLTLTLTAVTNGVYAPFEVPNPTPCCADHG
jgi:hypothetical protein